MGLVALTIATLCYLVTAFSLARARNWPMALVFVAYSIANVGLIWAAFLRK